ncbi:MAG: hypothetical protein ABJF86_12215 [Tateyamaria sp.]|uniref:hypothetical protein n=1 Tax=Tateyamaria sp. TaxID=1929288 RepID=UPI003271F699
MRLVALFILVLGFSNASYAESRFFSSDEEEYSYLREKHEERESLEEALREQEVALSALSVLREEYLQDLTYWEEIEAIDIVELKVRALNDIRERGKKILEGIYNPNIKRQWRTVLRAISLMETSDDAVAVIREIEVLRQEAEFEIDDIYEKIRENRGEIDQLERGIFVTKRRLLEINEDIADNTPSLLMRMLRLAVESEQIRAQCDSYNAIENRSHSYENGRWGYVFNDRGERVRACLATDVTDCISEKPFDGCDCQTLIEQDAQVPSRLAIPVCGQLP